jgi:hypothetical protein
MQHHLESDLFKGGVYDPRGAIETFSRGQAGHLAPIEVRAVHASNRTPLWRAPSHIRKLLLPSAGIPPVACPSALATIAFAVPVDKQSSGLVTLLAVSDAIG